MRVAFLRSTRLRARRVGMSSKLKTSCYGVLAWDKAVRGEHGGSRNSTGRNQHTLEPEVAADVVKADNIRLDLQVRKPPSDYGNSAQSGLRRLEKAASASDGNAADLLRRVVNPDDAMTVNSACVAMGWRLSPLQAREWINKVSVPYRDARAPRARARISPFPR